MTWLDDNPYFLAIADDNEGVTIDLGERDWLTRYAPWLRRPGVVSLARKTDVSFVLIVQINEGDLAHYSAHHVGITGSAGSNEIVAYGIGKTAPDGTVTQLWVMPGGSVCGGEDVDTLGVRMVKALGPRQEDE